jgi:hypothetical protein
MFIRPQNIYSLNNPVHLAILLILVQTINKNFTHPKVWKYQGYFIPMCPGMLLVWTRIFRIFGFSGLGFSHLYVFSQDRQQCLSRTQNIYSLNNPVHLAILLILVQTINKNFTHPKVWKYQGYFIPMCPGMLLVWTRIFRIFGFSGLGFSHLYVFSQGRQQCLSAPKTFIA